MKNIIFEEDINDKDTLKEPINTDSSKPSSMNNELEKVIKNEVIKLMVAPENQPEKISNEIENKVDSSKDENTVLKEKIKERYSYNLKRVVSAIKNLNDKEENLIKSQMPDDADKSGNINLPNQIYDMFNRNDIETSIIDYVASEMKNIDSIYQKKFGEKYNNLLQFFLQEKTSSKNYETKKEDKLKIININKIMDEYIYRGMSDYLIGNNSKKEIQDTYNNTPFLKQPYVEKLFEKINTILKYAIFNDKSISDIDTENAFDVTTKKISNQDWAEFSKNVLEEEPISSIDDIFVGSYKLLIKGINERKKIGRSENNQEEDEQEIANENKLYKNISSMLLEDEQESDVNNKTEKKLPVKKLVIDSYNNYRKNIYNFGQQYNNYIKYDNNLFKRFADILSDKEYAKITRKLPVNKESYDRIKNDRQKSDSEKNEAIKIEKLNNLKNILNTDILDIIKGVKKQNNEKNENNENDKETPEQKFRRGIINSINLFGTMSSMLNDYAQESVSEMVSLWRNIKKDGKVSNDEIEQLVNNLNAKINNEGYKELYLGDLIITELYLGMRKFAEQNNLDIDEDIVDSKNSSYIPDDDLRKFYILMDRFPTTEDYENYKNVYEKILSMNNTFDKLLSKYEETLTKSWFFKTGLKYLFGDYYILKDKKIKYDIWNTLLGDTNISPDIISFLRQALAYMHLSNIAHRKDKPEKSKAKETKAKEIAKEIIGDTKGITEKDICGIFASAGSTNPGSLSVNSMVTILMSSGFLKQQKIKCTRSFSPSRFYDSNPVLITSEDGKQLIGVITFYSFDKLTNLFKSGTNFGKWLFNFIKQKGNDSIV